MKKIIYLIIVMMLLNSKDIIAKDESKQDSLLKKRYSEYQKFLSTISNQDFSSATSNTSIDFQGASQAKFDISFSNKKDSNDIVRNNFSVKGTIGTNENLLSGKFLPKIEFGGGGYVLLNKKSGCFFRKEELVKNYTNNQILYDTSIFFRNYINRYSIRYDTIIKYDTIESGNNNFIINNDTTINRYSVTPNINILDSVSKSGNILNQYVLQRMTIQEANSIRLVWANYGGTFKYNHYRLLDSTTMRDSINKEISGNFFFQLNGFWMPHRQQGFLKNNNLIISGVIRYVMEFNGDNSDYLEKVTENNSTNSSFSTLRSSLLGDLKTGFKNTLSISAFVGLLIQNKILLGINADAVYEGIKSKNVKKLDNNSYLKLSFCLSSTSKENVYKTLQAVKVVPYVKLLNIFDNKPNRTEFGIATIFPINTFANRD